MAEVASAAVNVRNLKHKKSEVFKYFGFLYYGKELIDNKHHYCSKCVSKIVEKHPSLKISKESDLTVFFR